MRYILVLVCFVLCPISSFAWNCSRPHVEALSGKSLESCRYAKVVNSICKNNLSIDCQHLVNKHSLNKNVVKNTGSRLLHRRRRELWIKSMTPVLAGFANTLEQPFELSVPVLKMTGLMKEAPKKPKEKSPYKQLIERHVEGIEEYTLRLQNTKRPFPGKKKVKVKWDLRPHGINVHGEMNHPYDDDSTLSPPLLRFFQERLGLIKRPQVVTSSPYDIIEKEEDRKPGIMYDLVNFDFLKKPSTPNINFDTSTLSIHSEFFNTGFAYNEREEFIYGPYTRGRLGTEFRIKSRSTKPVPSYAFNFDFFNEFPLETIPKEDLDLIKYNWRIESYVGCLYYEGKARDIQLMTYIARVASSADFNVEEVLWKIRMSPNLKWAPRLLNEIFRHIPMDEIKPITYEIEDILMGREEIKIAEEALLNSNYGNIVYYRRMRNRVKNLKGLNMYWIDPKIDLFYNKLLSAVPQNFIIHDIKVGFPMRNKLRASIHNTNLGSNLKKNALLIQKEQKNLIHLYHSVKKEENKILKSIVKFSIKSKLNINETFTKMKKQPYSSNTKKGLLFIYNRISVSGVTTLREQVKSILTIFRCIKQKEDFLLQDQFSNMTHDKTMLQSREDSRVIINSYKKWASPQKVAFYEKFRDVLNLQLILNNKKVSAFGRKQLFEGIRNIHRGSYAKQKLKSISAEIEYIIDLRKRTLARDEILTNFVLSLMEKYDIHTRTQLHQIKERRYNAIAANIVKTIFKEISADENKLLLRFINDLNEMCNEIDWREGFLLNKYLKTIPEADEERIREKLHKYKKSFDLHLYPSLDYFYGNRLRSSNLNINNRIISPQIKTSLWRALISRDKTFSPKTQFLDVMEKIKQLTEMYNKAKLCNNGIIEEINDYTMLKDLDAKKMFDTIRSNPYSIAALTCKSKIHDCIPVTMIKKIDATNLEKQNMLARIKSLENFILTSYKTVLPEAAIKYVNKKIKTLKDKNKIVFESLIIH